MAAVKDKTKIQKQAKCWTAAQDTEGGKATVRVLQPGRQTRGAVAERVRVDERVRVVP